MYHITYQIHGNTVYILSVKQNGTYVYKNIDVGNTLKHKKMFPFCQQWYRKKKHLVYAKIFNICNKSTETAVICPITFRLMYLEGKSHPWSSERWQRTIKNSEKRENCPRTLHIVLSPPDKQSSPCQPHACPSNLPLWFVCVGVAPGTSPFGSTAAMGGRVPTPPVRPGCLYAEQHAHEIWTVLYCNGGAGCVIHKYGGVLASLRGRRPTARR